MKSRLAPFQRHVIPGGHEENITAYFSDIQGYSSFSEKLPAAQLVELLNDYLTVCTDTITDESGTLDKYIRDAVVAMFGAPIPLSDHAYRACLAALRVQQQLGSLRERWAREPPGRRASLRCSPASASVPAPPSSATWVAARVSTTP